MNILNDNGIQILKKDTHLALAEKMTQDNDDWITHIEKARAIVLAQNPVLAGVVENTNGYRSTEN